MEKLMLNADAAGSSVSTGDTGPASMRPLLTTVGAECHDPATPACVWIDRRGTIVQISPAGTELLTAGLPACGSSLMARVPETDRPAFLAFLSRIFTLSAPASCELDLALADGRVRSLGIDAVPAASGTVCLFIGDGFDPVAARQQIHFLSAHDLLTGLPNRRLGLARLQQALLAPRTEGLLAVVYIDLDKFKYVNDTHGHDVGDALLQAVTRRLQDEIGPGDTLCRTSANEFMAILTGMASHEEVSILCARMLHGLSSAFELKGTVLNISCCIGVAIAPEHGDDSETLMRKATTALHEARKAGASRYRFFEEQMSVRLASYVQIRDALTMALERDEFELHYQPQIDLKTGQVLGVEALIRWQRPGDGLTPPGAFIGVAEESGLIVPIGRWVLQQACHQAAAWHAAGWEDLVIAVNLSSVQFCAREELVEDVMGAIASSGLDPGSLELELTESSLLEHDQQIAACIEQWKASGIQLSIDDFGTGYSSLAYLKRLNVDKLKIDRAFIVGILDDEQDRAIVEAMIRVARSLNLRCLAEGVENEAEAVLLNEMGCDQAQGYFYSRPLPAMEMERWLQHNRFRFASMTEQALALHVCG